MLMIPCPWCGTRPHVEFAYGGDATVTRPAEPEAVSDQEWHDYVYIRDNGRGLHRELWQHVSGCRRWLKVLRDTTTHQVFASAPPDGTLPEPKP